MAERRVVRWHRIPARGRLQHRRPAHAQEPIEGRSHCRSHRQVLDGAFGEAHNHNIPSGDTGRTIRTYLEQGIFYVMIQTNVPGSSSEAEGSDQSTRLHRRCCSRTGTFTAPGGHPTALVRRNIANGGMTNEDLDGGFLQPLRSREDIDRVWWTLIKKQRPDFIKLTLVYSEDRVAGLPRPDSDRHGLDPSLTSYLVGKAHGDRLRVSAHVESAYDFDVAVAARADFIAHLPGFSPDADRIKAKGPGIYRISEDAARRAARQGTVVITTVGEVLRKEMPPLTTLRQVVDVLRWNFDVLKRHGVKIAIGSDQFRSTSVPEALAIAQAGLMTSAAGAAIAFGDHSHGDLSAAASPVRTRRRRAGELHCLRA